MTPRVLLSLPWVCLAAVWTPALGSVVRVPEDYSSVLAAGDAAISGDSVLVGPGTWTDREIRNLPFPMYSTLFLKPGVTVIGTGGADQTILDGGSRDGAAVETIVHVGSGAAVSRVIGLTVTGAGAGVLAVGSSPLELIECKLVRNAWEAVWGEDGAVSMIDCLIAENELERSQFSGAVGGRNVTLTCSGTTFERNAGPAIDVSPDRGPMVLRDCTFKDHKRRAFRLDRLFFPVTIERCTFLRNTTPVEEGSLGSGGAVALDDVSGSVRFCTFAYDSAGGGGGGLRIAASSVVVESNTFYRCHAGFAGGAASITQNDAGTHHNIVSECTGPRSSLRLLIAPHPTTGCNLFYLNESPAYDGTLQAPGDYFHRDPQFCDAPNLDFSLRSSSPAASGFPPCGQRGAHGVMCGPVSLESMSWGGIKSLYR